MRYDPDKGLKTVAVAEAAEKHYRRAKDGTRLLEAIELKLSEQRMFVLWWDGNGYSRPGSPILVDRRGLKAGRSGLPDSDTIRRWRAHLKDDGMYQTTLERAQARALKLVDFRQGGANTRMIHTGVEEWYTPPEYIQAARDVLGAIDLDPASSEVAQRTVQAARYFTVADDGLRPAWPGRVFLNPPYTQPTIARFVAKLVEEYTAGRTTAAILLTHNATDTAWFHHSASACTALCFTKGRIAFISGNGPVAAPTQGQAFHYFGAARDAFARRFSAIGFVR